MACITLSKTEELDHKKYCIDNDIHLTKKDLRRRHILRLFELGSVQLQDLPDDTIARCGYFFLSTDWIFSAFGKKDPMTSACSLHDSLYDPELRGDLTRKQVDTIFLNAMLTIAKDDVCLKKQAYLYYSIVRSTGWLFW